MKKKMSNQEIAIAESAKIDKECKYLEGEDFKVREARVEKVKATINEYLAQERLEGSSVIDAVIMQLFNCDYDINSRVQDLQSVSLELLAALTNAKIIKGFDSHLLKQSVKMLVNINNFAVWLNDDVRMAELELAFIEYDGESHMHTCLWTENEYLLKLKTKELQIENLTN